MGNTTIKVDSYSIAVANSRKATEWQNVRVTWKQLVDKLSKPVVTPETSAEYHSLTHDEQADIKDVGGFVGGVVQGGRRVKGSVPFRQILALDLDTTTVEFDRMAYELCNVWSFRWFMHTTRSYTPQTPRYRIIIPLSKPVDNIAYEAIGRHLANVYDINTFDPTTYQSSRLMYYPSVSSDGYFNCYENEGVVLDVDSLLSKHYKDYTNRQSWAYAHNDSPQVVRELDKAQDPLQKGGVVGAFCKAYSIRYIIEVKLSNYYTPASSGRYTYIGGSSSGGVVVYDDRWCYSHHSTDPLRGKLLNAFDLYRLVMFGAADAGTSPNTKVDNLPSYLKMVELCNADERVQKYMIPDEASDIALFNYSQSDDEELWQADEEQEQKEEGKDWLNELYTKLAKHPKTGKIDNTLNNIATILANDPNLLSNVTYDTFKDSINVCGPLPWQREDKLSEWKDSDDASARLYIEKAYGIQPKQASYNDAFLHVINLDRLRRDSALEFILRGEWDGVPRAEELLITTMGVDDTELNRQQTLIWLKAIVARQLTPGIKFDNMLLLSGGEGIGKSTLFRKLVGDDNFTDSFDFGWDIKKQYEAMRGKMIVESSDLAGMDKKEAESVKSLLSSQSNYYRKPYERRTSENPRRCVFAGSTNEVEVLRSQTGNRRMWVMKCNAERIITHSWDLLTDDYVTQLWAEVRTKYKEDGRLYLSPELAQLQKLQQSEFTFEDPLVEEILRYLRIWLPEQWASLPQDERQRYITSVKRGDYPTFSPHHRRTTVSAVEFICEWLGSSIDQNTKYQQRQINTALRNVGGLTYFGQVRDMAYGRLRSYAIDESVNGLNDYVAPERVEFTL